MTRRKPPQLRYKMDGNKTATDGKPLPTPPSVIDDHATLEFVLVPKAPSGGASVNATVGSWLKSQLAGCKRADLTGLTLSYQSKAKSDRISVGFVRESELFTSVEASLLQGGVSHVNTEYQSAQSNRVELLPAGFSLQIVPPGPDAQAFILNMSLTAGIDFLLIAKVYCYGPYRMRVAVDFA
jgi:hypothetical protein